MTYTEADITRHAMVIAGCCLAHPDRLDISEDFYHLGIDEAYVDRIYQRSLKLIHDTYKSILPDTQDMMLEFFRTCYYNRVRQINGEK